MGRKTLVVFMGKQLFGCKLLDVLDFKAVQAPEITIDEKDLSSDQKYLLGIFNAVRMGLVSPHLASQKIRTSQPLTLVDNMLAGYFGYTFLPPNNLLH